MKKARSTFKHLIRKRLGLILALLVFAAAGSYYVYFAVAQSTTRVAVYSSPGSGSTPNALEFSVTNPEPGKTYTINYSLRVEGSPNHPGTSTDATISPRSGSVTLNSTTTRKRVNYYVTYSRGCWQAYLQASYTGGAATFSYQNQIRNNGHEPVCSGTLPDPGGGEGDGDGEGSGGGGPGDGDGGDGNGNGPKGTGTGQAPGKKPGNSPTPSPSNGGGGGGGSSATKQTDKPTPIPKTAPQGEKQEPTKIEPSPFYDGKEYKRGTAKDILADTVNTTSKKVANTWPIAITVIILGGLAGFGYWKWRKQFKQ